MIPEQLREEPLIRVREASKKPVVDNYEVEATESVESWVEEGGNVGIALAETDTVVVDIDDESVLQAVLELFPETFTVETGSGWYHCYYCCEEWTANASLTGDSSIRSKGWMAVVPPSIHPETGERYTVHRDIPVTKVDEWRFRELVDRFGESGAGGQPHPPMGSEQGESVDRLGELIDHDGYREEVREVLEDRTAGHERRVWLAGFLSGAVGLGVAEIVDVIEEYNRWSNYDREVTRKQVESVVKSGRGGGR